MPKKQGKIIANGVVLEKHENATVVFLTSKGFNVELISPVLERKTPDIKMEKLFWEIKRPIVNIPFLMLLNLLLNNLPILSLISEAVNYIKSKL